MAKHPVPPDALDDRYGIVGTIGSGKTYTAMGMAQRLLASTARVVIVDPLDVWWGLRLMADGVSASPFNLPIFGGSHGDLPLTPHSGAIIGETVAHMAESCIVSLGQFESGAAERRFMLAFLQKLYRQTAGELVHLILDEADLWCPQQVMEKDGDAMALKGMVNTVVRRGRVKGFIPWLITQRPAVIDKSILSMVDGLVAMRLVSPQDREALSAWTKQNAAKESDDVLGDLPAMQTGEAVLWLPRRGIRQKVKFPPKDTYDSSRAPGRGETVQHHELRPLDLGQVRERLATVEAEVKASDPRELRAEVVRLTRELADARSTVIVDEGAVAKARAAAYDEGHEAGRLVGQAIGAAQGKREAFHDAIGFALAEVTPLVDRLLALQDGSMEPRPAAMRIESAPRRAPAPGAFTPFEPGVEPLDIAPPMRRAVRQPLAPVEAGAPLQAGTEKIIAAYEAIWPCTMELMDAAKHAGVGTRSSQFPGYKREVYATERLEQVTPGIFRATRRVGSAADLLAAYKAQFAPAHLKMFEFIERSATPVTRDQIIDAAGVSLTSSTWSAGLAMFVKEKIVERLYDGRYQLVEALRA